jgi:prepilin-type N-terminal cleavage/methylation domain-containing protein
MVYLMKKGFTLVELLVVIAIIGLLIGIFSPVLARVRFQSKILATNIDLRQISQALECYYFDNKKFPPTYGGCGGGLLQDHQFQLPKELANGRYLSSCGSVYSPMSTNIEDRFHSGHTYKYRSVGEYIQKNDKIDKYIKAQIWAPNGFPSKSSVILNEGAWYDNPGKSPVQWALFSLGPNFNEEAVLKSTGSRYPVPVELWYNSKNRTGFLVRLQLRNSLNHIGTFGIGR